jgi:hypothetical protein
MNKAQAAGRRHRRAASCYDFDFNTVGAEKTEEPVPAKQTRTFEDEAIDSTEVIKLLDIFCNPNKHIGDETSIVVDSIEGELECRQKKGLGLKFATNSMRILVERKTDNGSSQDESELRDRMPENYESPKSAQSKERIQRIQVKYVADLQKIDEDAHEVSLANSRNSLVLKNSAQKTLARIVRASGSGRKHTSDNFCYDNLILEEFDVLRGDFEDKENIRKDDNKFHGQNKGISGSHKKKSPTWSNDPILQIASPWDNSMPTIKETIVHSSSYSSQEATKNSKEVAAAKRQPRKTADQPVTPKIIAVSTPAHQPSKGGDQTSLTPKTGFQTGLPASLSKSFFLSKAFQTSAKSLTSAGYNNANQSSSGNSQQLIEKGNKLINKAKTDFGSRNCLKSTLQRLYNQRGRKEPNVTSSQLTAPAHSAFSQQSAKNTARPWGPGKITSIQPRECRDLTHVPGKEGRPKSRPSRGSEVSDSKSLLKSSKRRNVSEVLCDSSTLQEAFNKCAKQVKKRSSSISAHPAKPTLTKSQSATRTLNPPKPQQPKKKEEILFEGIEDLKNMTNAELQNIVKNQNTILNQLACRVTIAEQESRNITERYSLLRQENQRLQLELASLVSLGLNNSNNLKSLASRVESSINMR